MTTTFVTREAASVEAVAALRAAYSSLPGDYFDFLARSNGAEGDLGVDPGWFVVWPAEQAVSLTDAYGVPDYLPGFFAFGGDGGGELFVLPIAPDEGSQPVYMAPTIGMELSALIRVAGSFCEFAALMGRASPIS